MFVSVCDGSLDIVVVIDRTGYSSSEWTTTKTKINSLISIINSAFPISTNGAHIGIVTYTSTATTVLSLQYGTSLQLIQQYVSSVTSTSSSSHNVQAALLAAENEMTSNSRHQFQVRHRFHRFHYGQSSFHNRPGQRHDIPAADNCHSSSDLINRQYNRYQESDFESQYGSIRAQEIDCHNVESVRRSTFHTLSQQRCDMISCE